MGGCLVTLLVIGGAFAARLQHIAGTTGSEKVVHHGCFWGDFGKSVKDLELGRRVHESVVFRPPQPPDWRGPVF